jgi:hypothetical protein
MEITENDEAAFRQLIRMDNNLFQEILGKITHCIQRQATNLRRALLNLSRNAFVLSMPEHH